jgi:hypothetical protein
MAFIIRHTSGIVCAPLSAKQAKHSHGVGLQLKRGWSL